MAGNLVDLSAPGLVLPGRLVMDSNIVIDWLLGAGYLAAASGPTPLYQLRAVQLVERLRDGPSSGMVTTTSLGEVFHFVVKTTLRSRVSGHRTDIAARFPTVQRPDWRHLFKARSDLMKSVADDLDRARHLMAVNRMLVLQPDDLGPIPSSRSFEDELIYAMARYELDSSDAAILIEASRAGITAIASNDPDVRRARLDFDVYTWT